MQEEQEWVAEYSAALDYPRMLVRDMHWFDDPAGSLTLSPETRGTQGSERYYADFFEWVQGYNDGGSAAVPSDCDLNSFILEAIKRGYMLPEPPLMTRHMKWHKYKGKLHIDHSQPQLFDYSKYEDVWDLARTHNKEKYTKDGATTYYTRYSALNKHLLGKSVVRAISYGHKLPDPPMWVEDNV